MSYPFDLNQSKNTGAIGPSGVSPSLNLISKLDPFDLMYPYTLKFNVK